MIDMSEKTIKRLFEQQIKENTRRTIERQGDIFDFQLSGGWMKWKLLIKTLEKESLLFYRDMNGLIIIQKENQL